ncbi:MAG: DNA repair ATPase [Pseudomonadota bacterium]
MSQEESQVDDAVAQGGAYEVIRKRLDMQSQDLQAQIASLNQARVDEFGASDMRVVGRTRVRTENNCVARDIVQVGGHLLFGYNVFIGLKRETRVADVFALFDVNTDTDSVDMTAVPLVGSFLAEQRFVNDFDELYRYYKHTQLIELTVRDGKLLAGFQIGERLSDIRVFRWTLSPDGSRVEYIDNRGERDIRPPPAFDFDWIETSRDDFVHGRHAHINVRDRVFVETLDGTLTVKVENNTEDGLGIYSEPVEDATQSLDDVQLAYALVGNLILLKVRPYREQQWRFLIFNSLTENVTRVDAIGASCVQLPDDHGVIFPGGYFLETGEYKSLSDFVPNLKFRQRVRSPNGEDVLYVFYAPESGTSALLAYNLIRKELANPIVCHGYALAADGGLVIFSAEEEATRVHPMQLWHTPFSSEEHAAYKSIGQTFYSRIGNAELVRGVSDLYAMCRHIDNETVSTRHYEELRRIASKLFDDHFWLADDEVAAVGLLARQIAETADLVIDEFEKVHAIREQSEIALRDARTEQKALLQSVRPESWDSAEQYVTTLGKLRRQRGHLVTIQELRYIDINQVKLMSVDLEAVEQELSAKTTAFLSSADALTPYESKAQSFEAALETAKTMSELKPVLESLEATSSDLDLLSELVSTLSVDDATLHTEIIDSISQVYALLNRIRATARLKAKSLGSEEATAQFSAQFKLFSQSVANNLSKSDTPKRCDELLSRLLVQLEDLEGQFGEHEQFIGELVAKREEVYESFETRKQQLLDERQRKSQSIADAAERTLVNIEKRSLTLADQDALNTYFASDPLVLKVGDFCEQLRDLGSAVKADDIEARFKAASELAHRSLRDKSDIFEDDGAVIRLGPRHRFSVNTQELDLSIIPREGRLDLHLTGTDFFEPIDDPSLDALSDYWEMTLESEGPTVYRSEYLAYTVLVELQRGQDFANATADNAPVDRKKLEALIQRFVTKHYKEGYVKGVHDHDALLILDEVTSAMQRCDLLTFDPASRGLAQVFWANLHATETIVEIDPGTPVQRLSHETWRERAQSGAQMKSTFARSDALSLLSQEVQRALQDFLDLHPIPVSTLQVQRAAQYLVEELSREHLEFIGSKYAQSLVTELTTAVGERTWRQLKHALRQMKGWPAQRWQLSTAWLTAMVKSKGLSHYEHYIPEAVAHINAEKTLTRRATSVETELRVGGLLGEHPTIKDQSLEFAIDTFLLRLEQHRTEVVPAYQSYLEQRRSAVSFARKNLRLEEFRARPLSSFVRNRLINESYLPLIGDNLAKQMGTFGQSKRTDLMGLLMMISPPGYGKTTLMEYVASRLGLVFMKINCPALGHDVKSLDPLQAPNSTASSELEKLNLALEMGSNVMLYLDDIQHTHPEFLQKFISLCDGTRRIEGVWKGVSKTYDMRGKKFCVVMAGNPYTESGETFKVPDMLANRADIYNLGDILGGMEEQFALSYVENALTSNTALAPLATREMGDVYKLVAIAKGAEVATSDLSHAYSAAEINEITAVLRKMFVVQDIVLKINQQYIESAGQEDAYRVEPPFKLQGSYRNMNKMTEKISSVMNDEELQQMIEDHYLGEAQLLTTGAEANLLKLQELRGVMSAEERQRWEQIKADFLRNKAIGGDDADVGNKVVAQLVDLVNGVDALATKASASSTEQNEQGRAGVEELADRLVTAIQENAPAVTVENRPVPGIDKVLNALADSLEHSIMPLIRNMDKKLDIDLRTHEKMVEVSQQLRSLQDELHDAGESPPGS